MATSGPCGSDRLGTSLTSFTSALARYGHAISKPRRGWAASQTGTSLAANNARSLGLGTGRGRSRASGALVWLCAGRSGVKEKPNGENHTHHQQQELFVMVAARLATDKVLRAAIRGSHHRAGRRLGAGGNSLALGLDPGALPAARGRHRLGYAGDRRVSQRGQAGRRAAAGRPGAAGALPLDL